MKINYELLALCLCFFVASGCNRVQEQSSSAFDDDLVTKAKGILKRHSAEIESIRRGTQKNQKVENQSALAKLDCEHGFVDSKGNLYLVIDYNLWSESGLLYKPESRASLGDEIDGRIVELKKLRSGYFFFTLCEDD